MTAQDQRDLLDRLRTILAVLPDLPENAHARSMLAERIDWLAGRGS